MEQFERCKESNKRNVDVLFRAEEVKEHPFFHGIDWQQVYRQKYPPPLIPPRGEVNAADAFDIGSFDEEDTKGYKVAKHGARASTRVAKSSVGIDFPCPGS